jgi:hypothetical protein
LFGVDNVLFANPLFPAGDKIEGQFGNVGVVADNDEYGRRTPASA